MPSLLSASVIVALSLYHVILGVGQPVKVHRSVWVSPWSGHCGSVVRVFSLGGSAEKIETSKVSNWKAGIHTRAQQLGSMSSLLSGEAIVKDRKHDAASLRAMAELHRVHLCNCCVQYCMQCGRSRSEFYFCNISRNNCTVCLPPATLHCTQTRALASQISLLTWLTSESDPRRYEASEFFQGFTCNCLSYFITTRSLSLVFFIRSVLIWSLSYTHDVT